MSTLEYIPTYESQQYRRLSLEQELHRAESISLENALPEGFNVDENHSGVNHTGSHQMNFKRIFSLLFCCQI